MMILKGDVQLMFNPGPFMQIKINLDGDLDKWLHPYNSGGRLNKKDGLTRYGDSHVKDKTS